MYANRVTGKLCVVGYSSTNERAFEHLWVDLGAVLGHVDANVVKLQVQEAIQQRISRVGVANISEEDKVKFRRNAEADVVGNFILARIRIPVIPKTPAVVDAAEVVVATTAEGGSGAAVEAAAGAAEAGAEAGGEVTAADNDEVPLSPRLDPIEVKQNDEQQQQQEQQPPPPVEQPKSEEPVATAPPPAAKPDNLGPPLVLEKLAADIYDSLLTTAPEDPANVPPYAIPEHNKCSVAEFHEAHENFKAERESLTIERNTLRNKMQHVNSALDLYKDVAAAIKTDGAAGRLKGHWRLCFVRFVVSKQVKAVEARLKQSAQYAAMKEEQAKRASEQV